MAWVMGEKGNYLLLLIVLVFLVSFFTVFVLLSQRISHHYS